MTLPDWIKVGISIEDFMKSEEGVRPEDPMGMLRAYLAGDDIPAPTSKVPRRQVN